MSSKDIQIVKAKRKLIRDTFEFIALFIVVFFALTAFINEIIVDQIADLLFSNSNFTQFMFMNIDNYLYLFLTMVLAPYVGLLFGLILVGGIMSVRTYYPTRNFWLIFISYALALTIHLLVVYNNILDNYKYYMWAANLNYTNLANDQPISFIDAITFLLFRGYENNPNPLTLLEFYYFAKFFRPAGLLNEWLFYFDIYLIFLYFIIIFVILFYFFNKPCTCITDSYLIDKKLAKKPIRCSKRNWIGVVLGVLIATIPIINVVQIYNLQNINYIVWEDYYNPANFSSEPNFTNQSSPNFFIAKNASVYNYPFNLTTSVSGSNETIINQIFGGGNFSILKSSYELNFLYSMSTEIYFNNRPTIVDRLYKFDQPHLVDYQTYQCMYLGSTNFINETNESGLIWENCSNFWNKIDVYVYTIDTSNRAWGYRLTNESSTSALDFENDTIFSEALNRSIPITYFNVEASAIDNGSLPTYFRHEPGGYQLSLIQFFDEFGTFKLLERGSVPTTSETPSIFISFDMLLGHYTWVIPNALYSGFYIRIDEDADLDFNDDGFNEGLIFQDVNAFVGDYNSIEQIKITIQWFDIGMLAVLLSGYGILFIFDMRDKEFWALKQKCDLKTYEESPRYKYRDIKLFYPEKPLKSKGKGKGK